MKAFEHLYSSLLIQIAMLGTALFASACVAPGWSSPSVVVSNQLGYFPYAPKGVVVVSQDTKPLDWVLSNASAGTVVAQGRTVVAGNDAASGDHVHKIDLSSVRDEGTYVLSVASLDE
ncbi:MAG: cellulase N-terminal Ig-like domain-containing protein, partial [Myxococcota bacterium]